MKKTVRNYSSSFESNSFTISNNILRLFLISLIFNQSIIFITSKDLSQTITLTPLDNTDAIDISSNGDNTWFCTTQKQIVRLNPNVPKETLHLDLDLDGTLPKCSRIEANYDGSFYLIDDTGKLSLIALQDIELYKIYEISKDVLDVGCNNIGDCFLINKSKEVHKILKNKKTQKYFTLPMDGDRIDVGMSNTGGVFLVIVTKTNLAIRYDLLSEPTDKKEAGVQTKIFDIYATDVAIGADNRIYVATTAFGSFVYNEKSVDGIGIEFDRISNMGIGIAAGYQLYLIAKTNRIGVGPLVLRN